MTASSTSNRRRRQRTSFRIRLVLAVLLVAACTFVRAPGSVPRGWQYTTGIVSSSVGKRYHGATVYYPTIQYLALGYSYEITSRQIAPASLLAPGSGDYAVAFNPEDPTQAKLISDTPPNYFAVLFPAAAVLLLAPELSRPLRRLLHKYQARVIARVEREAAAPPPAPEPAVEAEAPAPEPAPGIPAEAEAAALESPAEAASEPATPVDAEPAVAAPPAEAEAAEALEAEEAVPPYAPGDQIAPTAVSAAAELPAPEPAPPAKPAKKPIAPKPSPPKRIYIPQVSGEPEPAPEQPRSAAGLKGKLKTPKPTTTAPRKKAAAKPKKPAAKKSTAKKAPAKARPTKPAATK